MSKPPLWEECPRCGGMPALNVAFSGHAYFVECGECGWDGDRRDFTTLPTSAMSFWPEKIARHRDHLRALLTAEADRAELGEVEHG